MKITFTHISGVIFALMALVHLMRVLNGWPVTFGNYIMPLWLSGIVVIVALGLAVWAFSDVSAEQRQRNKR